MKKARFSLVKEQIIILIFFLIAVFGLFYSVLFLDCLPFEKIKKSDLSVCFLLLFWLSFFVLFCTAYVKKRRLLYKCVFMIAVLFVIALISYHYLYTSRFLENFNSINDFREYVSSFGNASVIIFIALQFLQVVILPIPSIITTGAGVLLYGPLKGALFSIIGIVSGSIFAFFIGRTFGYNVVKWLVGEEALKKALSSISKSDKLLLPFTFLFPFFPDDLLCFVSGLTTVTPLYFIVTVLITRTIAVTFSSFSISNNLIPFNTWWGIILWMLFFAFTIFLTFYISVNGEKIKNKFAKLKTK